MFSLDILIMFKYITIFKMWIYKRVNKILARSYLYSSFLFDTTHLSYNPPWNRAGKMSPMLSMKTKQIPLGFCLQSGRSLAKAHNCIFQTEFFRKRENVLDRLTLTWLRSTQGLSLLSTKFQPLKICRKKYFFESIWTFIIYEKPIYNQIVLILSTQQKVS